jgi:nucleotide-binding universal stress UspA family protein
MGAPRRILAATDLSTGGNAAAWRGAELALQHGADLTLIHVVEDRRSSHPVPDGGEPATTRDHAAASALEGVAADVEQATGVAARSRIQHGRPDRCIVMAADEADTDLLCIGAVSERDAELGTVTERVVREAHCPVLVLRRGAREPVRTVLAASDLSQGAAAALMAAATLFPQAEFSLAHVVDTWQEDRARAAGVAEAEVERQHNAAVAEAREALGHWAHDRLTNGITPHLLVRAGDPRLVLRRLLGQYQPDVTAVGASGRHGVERLLLGSTATDCLRHAPGDILVSGARDANREEET